ncbi:MAG: hypothetical protein OXN84_17430 [Albidovulum sp.]|nr:hypothetical protein [Albidovulum sp.]
MVARLAHVPVPGRLVPSAKVARNGGTFRGGNPDGRRLSSAHHFLCLDEVAQFVDDAKPKYIACGECSAGTRQDLAARVGETLHTLGTDCSGSLTEDLADRPDAFDTAARVPDDPAAPLSRLAPREGPKAQF